MKHRSTRVAFDNGRGQRLTGIIDWPAAVGDAQPATRFALVSHCFTCTKDLKALVRISRRLAEHGWSVLRYDFTGLGDSSGDFSQTNFSTTCDDLVAAAEFLGQHHEPPQLLVGHSLGGTASVVAASRIASAKSIATIASPSSTQRLAGFLASQNPAIEAEGQGEVVIGQRTYLLRRQLFDDLRQYDIETIVGRQELPILMFHSPADETLPYEWGLRMFAAARGPKSFVTLDGADHLLVNQPHDAEFVADMIATWAARYVGT
jgi:putative redox protein